MLLDPDLPAESLHFRLSGGIDTQLRSVTGVYSRLSV